MNTCDRAQVWTTSHCQDQDHPQLTVQNLTFVDGNATGQRTDGGGGGAIFVRGGRFKVVSSRLLPQPLRRRPAPTSAARRSACSTSTTTCPVYVVRSTFGGAAGQGNVCSNGGALSSIGVSWVVLNSVMSHNRAIGRGANPARGGTPGGGSGGAIYIDGNRFTLRIAGIHHRRTTRRNEGGGAVFFVSNDRTGTMRIERSRLVGNPSAGFETRGLPGIFFLGARPPTVIASTLR